MILSDMETYFEVDLTAFLFLNSCKWIFDQKYSHMDNTIRRALSIWDKMLG